MTVTSATSPTGELEYDQRSGMWFRPGTYDRHIIGEVHGYVKVVPPRSDDVLLDIGANIGAVSSAWLTAGATVVAFEPEPDNFRLLTRNLARFDRARGIPVEAAVGGFDTPSERPLWMTTGTNYGIHSTVRRRGRVEQMVRCVPLDGMWAAYAPTVVKIDIEGGEYELIPALATLPATVRAVMIELHLTRANWRTEMAQKLVKTIEDQGLTPVRAPRIGQKNWTTLGAWVRPEEGSNDGRAPGGTRLPRLTEPDRSSVDDVRNAERAAKAPWE